MTADFTAVEAVRMTQLTYCLKDARTIRNAMKVMGERSEEAEEADTPPSHNTASFASIAQGLELFSIVSEQKQNALGFTPTVNAYNV